MDLNDHLKKLETFSRALSGSYAGAAGRDGPWGDGAGEAPAWYARAQAAVEFLERAGARPEVMEIKDGPKGAVQGLRLRGIDADALRRHLAGLGSARAIAAWVEEGVNVGAIAVRGERIFFLVDTAHDRGVLGSTASERGVEATGVVLEAAHQAMAAETASTLSLMEQAATAGGGQIVEFRDDLPVERRQVLAADAAREEAAAGARRARVVAGAEEIGPRPRFVVTGQAVKLADGTYYPVEAVDAVSRRSLRRIGATGVKVGQGGQQRFVRVDDTASLSSSARQAPAEEAGVDGAATADRRDKIQMAYRLLHGLTLDSAQGQPLDAGVASRMESFFGESLGNVKVYSGRVASEITEALSVEALSMGSHVVIPERLLRAASGEGERVLVHELAHVQQHKRGTEETRSVREAEADAAVSRFMTGKGRSLMDLARMPTRAPAPPPETAGSMPTTVYASAPRQGQPAPGAAGPGQKPGSLRSEKSLRRITQAVSRKNRQALEDVLDRQG